LATDRVITLMRDPTKSIYVSVDTNRGSESAYLPAHPPTLIHCDYLETLQTFSPGKYSYHCTGMHPGYLAKVRYEGWITLTHQTTPRGTWVFVKGGDDQEAFGPNEPARLFYHHEQIVHIPADGIVEATLSFRQCQSNAWDVDTCQIEPLQNGQGAVITVTTLPP
jgi:hypothetical protein